MRPTASAAHRPGRGQPLGPSARASPLPLPGRNCAGRREGSWWAHPGGGQAPAFKPTPDAMPLQLKTLPCYGWLGVLTAELIRAMLQVPENEDDLRDELQKVRPLYINMTRHESCHLELSPTTAESKNETPHSYIQEED
jgi:hypothetical protein